MAAKKGMTDGAKKVLAFLQENGGDKFTNAEVATALGISGSVVSGSVTGLVNKGRATREPVEVANEAGKVTTVNYIQITDEGLAFDPDEEVKED